MAQVRAGSERSGYGFGLGAYGLWGVLPLYFVALAPASATEILAWRIVLSLVLCVAIVAVSDRARETFRVLRIRRSALLTAVAGFLIFVNWGIFVIATQTGHVVDAALGYFINPLVTALLGVLILGERLRPAQWGALGLGGVAVVVLVVGYGQFPWIALGLAFSFGLYGFVKKTLGAMPALTGLTLETLWVTPVAIAMLIWVQLGEGLAVATGDIRLVVLMSLAGVVTTVPLLLFAAAVRRLQLTTVGLLQYVNPVLQALVGIVLLSEHMPPERWWGVGLILLALVVFALDTLRSRSPRA